MPEIQGDDANSIHTLPVAENRLRQNFTISRANQVWVTDLTYIDTGEGWPYLAGIKDLHKQELVHQQRYATREEAIADITESIEIFYNRQSRHSKLDYLSPAAFAQKA
jgi:transposase InsO family protein